MAGFLPSSFWHIYGMRQSLSQQKCQKESGQHPAILEMMTSGDLKSGDTLFCTTPSSPDCQLPPTVNSPPDPIPPPTK